MVPPTAEFYQVYHIIAADTQDIFLNNISFGKAVIMEAFTKTTPSTHKLSLTFALGHLLNLETPLHPILHM